MNKFSLLNDKTCCVGGKPYSDTNKIIENEKVNRKTQKLVKFIKEICDKSQVFTK